MQLELEKAKHDVALQQLQLLMKEEVQCITDEKTVYESELNHLRTECTVCRHERAVGNQVQ